MAEYVWIGGTGGDLRSKCRTLNKMPKSPADLPTWNYDGSSTGQAPGDDSEVFIVPRAIYKDPFRKGDNILVMCDAYEPPDPKAAPGAPLKPIPTNTRFSAAAAMEKVCGRGGARGVWCVGVSVAWEEGEPETPRAHASHPPPPPTHPPTHHPTPHSIHRPPPRSPGSASSRSTPCSTLTPSGRWGGPPPATPAPRGRTTAPPGRAPPSAATSSRLTTKPASTPASTSRA